MKSIDLLKKLLELSKDDVYYSTSIRSLYAMIRGLEGDDFVVFLNGGGNAFDIWLGTKTIESMHSEPELDRYICFAKCGDKDIIYREPMLDERNHFLIFRYV